MNLNLANPIVFFDLETTGVNIAKDRVVEISVLKVYPHGKEEQKTIRINPEMPIPKEASAIHGIYDEDVNARFSRGLPRNWPGISRDATWEGIIPIVSIFLCWPKSF